MVIPRKYPNQVAECGTVAECGKGPILFLHWHCSATLLLPRRKTGFCLPGSWYVTVHDPPPQQQPASLPDAACTSFKEQDTQHVWNGISPTMCPRPRKSF